MTAEEIRKRFLTFFEKRGHAVIPSASLVPEHDPSVLFTTAGVQPLVPYILGEEHPQGKRLVNIQKCVRTQDIEEVGDKTHDTFFEMLGNWSLGDYFKKDAIQWGYEFLTSKKEGLGLDPDRFYITCFSGDEDAPKDEESAKIWGDIGIPKERIFFFGKNENWWSPGDNGPSGPDTEIFYDLAPEKGKITSQNEFVRADDAQRVVELWNLVFMEHEKKGGKIVGKLNQHNVDTGVGLERLAMVLQGTDNIFDTDLFKPLMEKINEYAPDMDIVAKRVIADHVRTAAFITGDGVTPSNTDRGYILRRLLRRAILRAHEWPGFSNLYPFIDIVIEKYKNAYPNLETKRDEIHEAFEAEETTFGKTLRRGLQHFEKYYQIGVSSRGKLHKKLPKRMRGSIAFELYTTYGFPRELIEEEAKKRRIEIDWDDFEKLMEEHRQLSRRSAEKKFKGGLADHSEMSVKYHTATHLLHQALRDVLGSHVHQKGSNITPERLRFDFNFERKMTPEEIKRVEDIVNKKIQEGIAVTYEDIPLKEAEKRGAIGLFEEKYGDRVRVYSIGAYSLEYCGGPHVKNTADLDGEFHIVKEESVASGIRRIKAVLK